MIIAHDAIGGFFALDGGGLGDARGEIFYFAPDSLNWEGLDMGYDEWLEAMMGSLFMDLYAENLWDGWQREAAALSLDEGLRIEPPLWTNASRPIEKTTRKAVPMLELWNWEQEARRSDDDREDSDDDEYDG